MDYFLGCYSQLPLQYQIQHILKTPQDPSGSTINIPMTKVVVQKNKDEITLLCTHTSKKYF